ncbi:MAG: SAM-dependent methyltransferase, partial [Pseudomonadota bacterium]
GLFMAALPGDQTLKELRAALIETESELTGNASMRVDPFGEIRQYGGLLQRAGLTLPVADSEIVTASYAALGDLAADLRSWGATNSLKERPAFAGKHFFKTVGEKYQRANGNEDGKFLATFEVVFLTAWSPHESQQKPLRPGSGENRLADILSKDKKIT